MMNWFYKLRRININEEKYDQYVLHFAFGVLGIILSFIFFHLYPFFSEGYKRVFDLFVTADCAFMAFSLAFKTFILPRENPKASPHLRIVHNYITIVLIWGVVVVAISIIAVLFNCIEVLAIGFESAYFIFLIIGIIVMTNNNWIVTVSKNMEKYSSHIRETLQLKAMFRSLCQELDNRCESISFFSQVDSQEGWTKKEKKYLKKLNDLIDNTKIGREIKDPIKEYTEVKRLLLILRSCPLGNEVNDTKG